MGGEVGCMCINRMKSGSICLQMVTEHLEMETEGQMELSEEDEEDLCKVWDMAMDKVRSRIITFYFSLLEPWICF